MKFPSSPYINFQKNIHTIQIAKYFPAQDSPEHSTRCAQLTRGQSANLFGQINYAGPGVPFFCAHLSTANPAPPVRGYIILYYIILYYIILNYIILYYIILYYIILYYIISNGLRPQPPPAWWGSPEEREAAS